MSGGFKDSPEVVEFRMLFARLKKWSKNDPDYLRELAHEDKGMEELGLNVLRAAGSIQKHERLHRDLFTERIDPKFISEWRDFEERFASTLLSIRVDAATRDIFIFSFDFYEEPDQWVMADYNAMSVAKGLDMTMRYARMRAEEAIEAAGREPVRHEINIKVLGPKSQELYDQMVHAQLQAEDTFDDLRNMIRDDITSSPDEAQKSKHLDLLFQIENQNAHVENPEVPIEDVARDGWAYWETLKHESGLDLRGILRRRALIPFVLFPRHVSDRLSSTDLPSIYQNLRQAQEAFVYGIPFAALALMRSVMEGILRDHYGGTGTDLQQCIISVADLLPRAANAGALDRLRMLANDVLHKKLEKDDGTLHPQWEKMEKRDFERQIISMFFRLRTLIEESPLLRAR